MEVLGREPEWNRKRSEAALQDRLAEIRLGLWRPAGQGPAALTAEPSFQQVASEWYARRQGEVSQRTRDYWRWALELHALGPLGELPVSELTAQALSAFTTAKISEREARAGSIAKWEAANPRRRGRRPSPGLSNASINSVVKIIGMVLDDAVEAGLVAANVARSKRRKLPAGRPRRSWLELDQARALLDAAGPHRALIAVQMLGGLRVGEAIALRWRSVDLARGRLTIEAGKTSAARRTVDLSPDLREALLMHRQAARDTQPDALVFVTRAGTQQTRHNVRRRVLLPSVQRANQALVEAGMAPISELTNHSLRRTYCALAYEAGASPAFVMAQLGHVDAALSLEVYAKVVERTRDTGERIDALLRAPIVADGLVLDALQITESA
jgi:integrase